MSRLRGFAAFLYDFIIGDDPVIAVVVVLALGVTAVVAASGVAAWWVMPIAVVAVLAVSVQRAADHGVTPAAQPERDPVEDAARLAPSDPR